MIEMLGVLAIIGVLSVGGIMGYSKAMMKFKVNKTADQVATIVANTRTLFASQKKYSGLNAAIAKKAHLLPDEMDTKTGTDWAQFENAFGGGIYMHESGKNTGTDAKAFDIILGGIPEEACMELATMDWGSGSSSGLIAVGVGYSAGKEFVGCQGNTSGEIAACPNGTKVPVPMPVSIAATACSGNNNILGFKYY